MKVAIDLSQIVDGTGVSNYTIDMVNHLPKEIIKGFAFSMTKASLIHGYFPEARVLPIGRKHTDLLWNRLHLNIDPFIGDFDILHTSDWIEPKSSKPKVTTVHDLSPVLFPELTSPEIVEVHKRKLLLVSKESAKIICVSNNTAQDLMNLYKIPESKIEVVYQGMSTKMLLKPNPVKFSNYILAMGSRQPRKNISKLISSYKKFKSSHSLPGKLIITGETTLVSDDPDIIITGYISDQELVDLFASSSVFVYPSLYEGFGQPILSAFHFETPVVAGNNSSISEVVGNAGVLVDVGSELEIAEGIKEAIKHSKSLINKGLIQLKKFNWESSAEQTIKIYNSLY